MMIKETEMAVAGDVEMRSIFFYSIEMRRRDWHLGSLQRFSDSEEENDVKVFWPKNSPPGFLYGQCNFVLMDMEYLLTGI